MRTVKTRPSCQTARSWLKLRRGKHCLAPLTGSTSRLFSAYVHLVEAWVHSEEPGVERALREVVALMQPSEWSLCAEAIAHVGDWGHIDKLWSRIRPPRAPFFVYDSANDTVLRLEADNKEVA